MGTFFLTVISVVRFDYWICIYVHTLLYTKANTHTQTRLCCHRWSSEQGCFVFLQRGLFQCTAVACKNCIRRVFLWSGILITCRLPTFCLGPCRCLWGGFWKGRQDCRVVSAAQCQSNGWRRGWCARATLAWGVFPQASEAGPGT